MYTIVAQSHSPGVQIFWREKRYVFSYHLIEPLKFTEPHFARLLWLGGGNSPNLVFVDFVKRQNVNGILEPYIGCSAAGSLEGWVPLASDHIPSFGYIQVESSDKKKLSGVHNYTAIFEIAPESFIKNGATG